MSVYAKYNSSRLFKIFQKIIIQDTEIVFLDYWIINIINNGTEPFRW